MHRTFFLFYYVFLTLDFTCSQSYTIFLSIDFRHQKMQNAGKMNSLKRMYLLLKKLS